MSKNLSELFPPGGGVSGGDGAPAVHVGPNPPADPVEGQQWLNTNDGFLYIYYENAGNPTWMAVEREGVSGGDGGGSGGDGGGGGGDASDPDWNSVSLLLNGDDEAGGSQNIIDATGKNVITVVNNTQIDTAIKKYGTGSMKFSGGDYLLLENNMDLFDFGAGDFTVEFWLYPNEVGRSQLLFDTRPHSTNGAYVAVHLQTNETICYRTANKAQIESGIISVGSWIHVAVSRSGTSTKLFIDGAQEGITYSDSQTYLMPPHVAVAAASSNLTNTNKLNGYIDDLRVTKGVARYTTDFTPPDKLPTKLGARVITIDAPEEPAIQGDSNDADLP